MATFLLHLNTAAAAAVASAKIAENANASGAQLPDKTRNSRVLVLGGTGRVGGSTATALSKLCPDLRIVVGGRNRAKGASMVATLGKNSEFAEVDVNNKDSLEAALSDVDLVVHAAGPFQQAQKCTVLEAAIETQTAYLDFCDDTSYAFRAKSFKERAVSANIPAITTGGIYPGVSNGFDFLRVDINCDKAFRKMACSSSSSSAVGRLSNISNHLCPTDSNPLLKVSAEVSDALSRGLPVVALESTIISHGMPYPQNLETAKEVEAIVRENGAVPATIAILDGVPCIGLNFEQLERLARLGKNAQKTARRDIAFIVATKRNGATTVSATMFFAAMVGIPVFVTGGTGGVHRHGEHTMDISSDLTELGRTPVAVVSAGVKSILDIPRTLEYLETQGVCVAAYKTNEFPAFFTQTSGCKAPCRVDSPEECARLIDANRKLNLGNGLLIAVPIPKEHAASGSLIESAIQQALAEAREKNVTGNAETPFLLARVNEITGGASLTSNIALVKNNAAIGAKISVALAQLRSNKGTLY